MKQKIPKKITKKYLINYSLWYLEHFYCSENKLRFKLKEKIITSSQYYNEEYKDLLPLIDVVISFLFEQKLLNDDNYAKSLLRNYIKKGKSKKYIYLKLIEKKIQNPDDFINSLFEHQSDWERVAITYCIKNKKLGCFNLNNTPREKQINKLAQYGFNFSLIDFALSLDFNEVDDYLIEPDLFIL